MVRSKRRKVLVRADLEKKLAKYGRRMQRLSEEAYIVRQVLEHMDRSEVKVAELPTTATTGQGQ